MTARAAELGAWGVIGGGGAAIGERLLSTIDPRREFTITDGTADTDGSDTGADATTAGGTGFTIAAIGGVPSFHSSTNPLSNADRSVTTGGP
jgi:hypothetical protein